MPTETASQMMDVEPGGEGGQYEGRQVLVGKTSVDSKSQFNESYQQHQSAASQPQSIDPQMNRDEPGAEDIRNSELLSENGYARKTSGYLEKANQGTAFGKSSETHDR